MSSEELTILYVDDDNEEHFIMREMIDEINVLSPVSIKLIEAMSFKEGLNAAKNKDIDISLVDYNLGEKNGLDFIKEVVDLGYQFPLILLTGHGAGEIDELAIQAGASDYLEKGAFDEKMLWRTIRYARQRRGSELQEKKLQMQLYHSEKLACVGQLAAGVAHEINTPIQYVGDNTHFLEENLKMLTDFVKKLSDLTVNRKAIDDAEGLLSQIQDMIDELDIDFICEEVPLAIDQSLEGISRVSDIVKAMKEFSHPGAKEKSIISINDAVRTTITVAKNEWKYVADIQTELDQSLSPISCFPNEVNQVILNMIVNAAHAISDRQKKNNISEKGIITIRTKQKGNCAQIQIQDDGGGIPEHIKNDIFNPFFTTKAVGEGTGQGLSMAHSIIVEKHNGTIEFESIMNEGTTFYINIPYS